MSTNLSSKNSINSIELTKLLIQWHQADDKKKEEIQQKIDAITKENAPLKKLEETYKKGKKEMGGVQIPTLYNNSYW